MIEHDNIFYIRDLSELGGVETYIWELVKRYKDYDIAVVYKSAHPNQLNRLKKLCRTYKHINQRIKCKVAIINYDVSIIDFIEEGAKIYQGIHGDYENSAYKWKPPTHERIYKYLAITKHIEKSFKKLTGCKNVELCYNPLSIEKQDKPIILLSATRLSPIKGKERMAKLADALDKQGVNYVWLVFTNDRDAIQNPNIIYMKPNLDIGKYFELADYLVQLSDTEACSYSINEMLYRNKPVIVTPLPYLDEIGVKDGENCYIVNFNCDNIDDVTKKIKKIPKFNFEKLPDRYDEIIVKGKSRYKEIAEQKVKVRCIRPVGYFDMVLNKTVMRNEEFITDRTRAEYLEENNAVVIVEVVK